MSRNPLHNRLISIVEPAVQAAGYELVDLRFVLEQGGWTLRVAIDMPLPPRTPETDLDSLPNRVDLTACEQMSRELSAVLDVEDPIPQAFSLEVSSPGIDRPLRTADHYAYFVGCEAKLQTVHPIHVELPSPSERKNFKGTLKGVIDGKVAIDCDGTTFQVPIDDIDHAKLVPDWDAVMKGKSGFGKHPPQGKPGKPKHHKQEQG